MDTNTATENVENTYSGNERRHNLRYKLQLRVQLIGGGMLPMQVKTSDVSIAGLHFDCDTWTAQHLQPPGEPASPANGKQFTARFPLPLDGGGKMLTLLVRVISVQRISQDKFRANVRFVQFGGKSHVLLQEYLETLDPLS